MTAQKDNLTLKIFIGVLAVLLLALAGYTYITKTNLDKHTAQLEEEKGVIEEELNELITKYDNAIALNEVMDDHLLKAKERIVVLLDSVKDNAANLTLISRYRREVNKLKKERDRLFQLADSLTTANTRLATDLDSTSVALNQNIIFSDSLSSQNQKLSAIVERGAALTTTSIRAEGVKVKNSGKIVNTTRASRADKVRVCFTLAPNKLTEKGDKELYVQVVNPKNTLIGDKISINFEDAVLTYSGRNKVFYENNALDVCILVDTAEGELTKGNYTVNVFAGPKMITKTKFELK